MRRIVIIGAGASGMACAEALKDDPQNTVTIIERTKCCGGMATSEEIDPKRFGASFINDGVQGASPQFSNTYAVFDLLGFKPSEVKMQVSFGRDPEEDFWSNVFPSAVIDKYAKDIKKFGWVLKVIKSAEPLFGLIPVDVMLKIFGFSQGFGDVIVYPLVALFMGTGQQTPYVSSVILERLFLDPSMKLFDYSPDSFLDSIPPMRAFPRLSEVYSTWQTRLTDAGVSIMLETQATAVKRAKDKVTVTIQSVKNANTLREGEILGPETEMEFDEIVFACDADTALTILGTNATVMEKKVLGNVKYLYDVSVTHCDREYMEKYYRLQFDEKLFSEQRKDDPKERGKAEFAKENFKPLYFIRSYPSDKKKIEMSFDLTHYQPQFDSQDNNPDPEHVYQTIFLDKDDSSHLWTEDEINPNNIILKKWWKQQSHRWQHYGFTVPWMMWINGKNRTHYCGAWTVLNMHEIAIASGFAVAYRLGAKYPFKDDDQARRMFALVLGASHGVRMRKEDRKGFFY